MNIIKSVLLATAASVSLTGCLTTIPEYMTKPITGETWKADEFGVTTSTFYMGNITKTETGDYFARNIPYSLKNEGEEHTKFKRMFHSTYLTPDGIPNALIYSDPENSFFITEVASTNKRILTVEDLARNIPRKTYNTVEGLFAAFVVDKAGVERGMSYNAIAGIKQPYVQQRFIITRFEMPTPLNVDKVRDMLMKNFYGRDDIKPNSNSGIKSKPSYAFVIDVVSWSDGKEKSKIHTAYFTHVMDLQNEYTEYYWLNRYKDYLNATNFMQY